MSKKLEKGWNHLVFPRSLSDPVVQQRRKKFGGNKRRNYTEGWVEFADKKVAKAVAVTLNNTPVGGKKRHYYHDDLWNIKYLSKFRWTHLTEKKGMSHSTALTFDLTARGSPCCYQNARCLSIISGSCLS